MARSAKIPLPTQDELESHKQLSLFTAKRAEEIRERSAKIRDQIGTSI